MTPTLVEDLQLLSAAARRHSKTLGPRGSVHVSAAVDGLTDPLSPPDLVRLDDSATADLPGVLRTVRRRLEEAARHSTDPRRALRLALAARELTSALAVLQLPAPSAAPRADAACVGDATPASEDP
jgi:hypothetical protein